MTNLTIISEIGSNYNGNLDTAKQYIKESKIAGATCVKFQTIRKEHLLSPRITVDGKRVSNPVYDTCLFQELPNQWHFELKKEADEQGIEFLSTPFYLEAVDLLERVGVKTYKIASGDITFTPLLTAVGRARKHVILSTGASSMQDIEAAMNTLSRAGAARITLLHCVSNYPPQWEEMNVMAIVTLKETFGVEVGISDHSPGSLVPIMAVTLGATVIEKHVTFDRGLQGPDHPYALTMDEFARMVQDVHTVEKALGNGVKMPTPAESLKQNRMRRGIYDMQTTEPVADKDGRWLRPEHSRRAAK